MSHNTTTTSIEAYYRHRTEGKIGPQCVTLLDHMKPGEGYSRKELSNIAGVELAAVCARVNEMVKEQILTVGDKRPCTITGRNIIPVIRPAT